MEAIQDTVGKGGGEETQPATESQIATSMAASPAAPSPNSPSSMASSAGKLAEQEVICLQIGARHMIHIFSPKLCMNIERFSNVVSFDDVSECIFLSLVRFTDLRRKRRSGKW